MAHDGIFDGVSPLDYRYYGSNPAVFEKLQPFLSENAMIEYMAAVEVALIEGFVAEGICPASVLEEVRRAAVLVTAEKVYAEEKKSHHLMRALVSCLRAEVSSLAQQWIHLTATSHDIIGTAETFRYQECTQKVILPKLLELEKTLIYLALQEKKTLQIGRTHGQHAVPLTFGFSIAEYVARIGERIHEITTKALQLRGQLSGAVGAYNAAVLVVADPIAFEKKVLERVHLRPATHSTQIVIPEFMADYIHSIISCFGVLAKIADDMRHLQRTEIGEITELFGEQQVGSSTMPHKKNPINFEQVKSLYKAMMPRMTTLYLDQISEHQRDMTNSASSRFSAEIVVGFYCAVEQLTNTMKKITVDKDAMRKNFEQSRETIIAEPLYILLSVHGYPHAHEKVRQLALLAFTEKKSLFALACTDPVVSEYLQKCTAAQRRVLEHPEEYVGKAVEKTEQVCEYWKTQLGII